MKLSESRAVPLIMKLHTRKPLLWLLAASCVLASGSFLSAAGGDTTRTRVTYEEPDTFTDLRDGDFESQRGRQHTLDELSRHIEKRAASVLPEGYTLSVVVSDIDLAGDYEPWRTKFTNVRIVRDIYPPRISLTYTLRDAEGQVVSEAQRDLKDTAFLQTLTIDRNDTLRFEKALIDAWIRTDIRRAASAS